MAKDSDQRYLTYEEARRINNPSENWFATMFFKSVLYKLGYTITHEPEEFFARLHHKKRSTLVDFEIIPPSGKVCVATEVTESLGLKNKAHQRQVMNHVVRPDMLAYIQLPWKILMAPRFCFGIIRQIAEGTLSNTDAVHQLARAQHDPNFQQEYFFPPGQFHN